MAARNTSRARAFHLSVGIGELQASNDPNCTLITHALGSCIAVLLYDPVNQVAGMLHYMLPMSKTSPEKAKRQPALFADRGVPLLFEKVYAMGGEKENLVVKVCGGASLNNDGGLFNIGRRNYTVLRKMFWQNKIIINAKDVGGSNSRTASITVATGSAIIRSMGVDRGF